MKRARAPLVPALEHHRVRLDNGLQLVLHPDRRLPRVALNLLYHVGARDDPPGREGLAHLFEHLMFMGTRRLAEGELDLMMERAGGWNNAYTSEDLTVYYDVGPGELLERLLWAEADRMSGLAGALDRGKLELQRGVVLNELWQECVNAPYGDLELQTPALLYPGARRHPYAWPVIGSEEAVRSVRLAEVRRHARRFYCPANAALVLAGDLDPGRARDLVERYFGWIPAGPGPRPRPRRGWRGLLRRPVRRTFDDRVELPRLLLSWHSPGHALPGDAALDLAGQILSDGKQSRLHRELVLRRRLAARVLAYQCSRQLCSSFSVEVTARPGVDRAQLERLTLEMVGELARRPPTRRELLRARRGHEASFLSGLQRLTRRAELFNQYGACWGEVDGFARDLDRYRAVEPPDVRRWLAAVVERPGGTFWVVPRATGGAA